MFIINRRVNDALLMSNGVSIDNFYQYFQIIFLTMTIIDESKSLM